ncbi:DoxX family membrane protein [Streptomyces sp. NPDC049879]|uniref:DoxX family membrane protein n=1 Tax=Streptomyces sp. NPDC049879 TaxID=3365598 RepID=UPI0037BCC338
MDVLVLIGRIVFALLFLLSAFNHLTRSGPLAAYAAGKGLPSPRLAVLGSGVLLLVGSLSLLLGVWPDLGALLLVVFLVPTALVMHNFWTVSDPGARANDMLHFQKDMALAGAALAMAGLFAVAGDDVGLTWTKPLFG